MDPKDRSPHASPDRMKSAELARLWMSAQPVVFAFVRSLVTRFDDAEDIVQQVAVTVAENFDEYDPSRPFNAWAIGIARVMVMRYYGKYQPKHSVLFDSQLIDRLVSSIQDQHHREHFLSVKLETCIARLSERARKMLDLRYVRDLTPNEIADRLGTSSNTVRVGLYRIRQALKDCMLKIGNPES